jgi:hypothetical protein
VCARRLAEGFVDRLVDGHQVGAGRVREGMAIAPA